MEINWILWGVFKKLSFVDPQILALSFEFKFPVVLQCKAQKLENALLFIYSASNLVQVAKVEGFPFCSQRIISNKTEEQNVLLFGSFHHTYDHKAM